MSDEVAAEPAPATAGFVARFLFIWLCSGFAIGTLVLLGPVRWWAATCRRFGWVVGVERSGVAVLIVLLIATSAWLSIRLARRSSSSRARLGIPIATFLFAAGAYYLWVHPSMLSASMGAEETTSHFTFGPYPSASRMRRLKADGFTVISLLSPAVVPFEPQLIAQEEKMAKETGVPLLHIPMLPWVSGNGAAIQKIRALARDKSHLYYVHCYLGKDRVQIVRRVVEEETGVRHTSYSRARALNTSSRFERGKVYELGDDGFLIPCPTDEEIVGYILAGDTRSVAALLDPQDPDDRRIIDHERKILEDQGIRFVVIPANGKPEPAAIAAAIRIVKQLPRPFVVHAFFTPENGRAPWAKAFMDAYKE